MWWEALGQTSVFCCDTNIVEAVLSRDLCLQTLNTVFPPLQNRWNQPVEQIKAVLLAHQENCCHLHDHPAIAFPMCIEATGEKESTCCCVTAQQELGAVLALREHISKAPAPCREQIWPTGQESSEIYSLQWTNLISRKAEPRKKENVDRTSPCCSRSLCNNISWQSC